MSNILEDGNWELSGHALLKRLRLLRLAYQGGSFTEPTTVPLPEIVADGYGPDDWLGGSPEGAPARDGGYRRDGAFRVAPDVQGRPFCRTCGVLQCPSDDHCPICGNS